MTIKQFIDRLAKIGIKVELCSNYPWLYLSSVNGKKIKEINNSKRHFTIAIQPVKVGDEIAWEDFSLIFKTLRKYL